MISLPAVGWKDTARRTVRKVFTRDLEQRRERSLVSIDSAADLVGNLRHKGTLPYQLPRPGM